MADADVRSEALLPARPTPQRRRQKWAVEFARFFRTPRRDPSKPPPPGLRLVARGKLRHHGTWLPAASPAALSISCPSQSFAVPVLTVSIGDVVFVRTDPAPLPRGAFCVHSQFFVASGYMCDTMPNKWEQSGVSLNAFLYGLFTKECSTETMDIRPSGRDYLCEDSSASEYIASSGIHQSFEEPDQPVHRTETPALGYHAEPDEPIHRTEAPALSQRETPSLRHHEAPEEPLLQPLLATNIDTVFSGFPPSFTDMLTQFSCKTEKDAEEPYPVTATDHAPQEVSMLDTSHNGTHSLNLISHLFIWKSLSSFPDQSVFCAVAISTTSANEIDVNRETSDIMTRIKTYISDGAFHDMLFKLERVIDELGGDLSL
uniref:Poor homologous synapsis 1 PH domain-containing protein n=2 Tax=Oryza TaxID=4527 RepID=A0A0D3GGM4_9ORYZ